jgi:hypothetical protein
LAPAAKLLPLFQPSEIVPEPLAEMRCRPSATVLMPRASSVSVVSTVTGAGVSVFGAAQDRAGDEDHVLGVGVLDVRRRNRATGVGVFWA